MRVSVISTGNELLQGRVQDTNSRWLAQQLLQMGCPPVAFFTVGDSVASLVAVLKQASACSDVLICSGGLGPTSDDVTGAGAAAFFEVPLWRHPTAERQVRTWFELRNRTMSMVNLKQADVPRNARILENPLGTAPGFCVVQGNRQAFFLPGVPGELEKMFHRHVAPIFDHVDSRKRLQVRSLFMFDVGESRIQELLAPLESTWRDVTLAYCADYPVLSVTLQSTNARQLESCFDAAQSILKAYVFSTSTPSLPHALGELLTQSGVTIGCGESCTGGLIASQLTDIPGSTAYFRGGVVAYDNAVKTTVLGVPAVVIFADGAVSESVVVAMANGVKRVIGCQVAVATSGIAGPGGGTPRKPVGRVHIAVAIEDRVVHRRCDFGGYPREKVKMGAAWTAMKMVFDEVSRQRRSGPATTEGSMSDIRRTGE